MEQYHTADRKGIQEEKIIKKKCNSPTANTVIMKNIKY